MNLMNSKYKHVIWDWNGTLLDDLDIVIGVMNSLLEKRKMNIIDRERYLDIFDFPVINYYTKLGFDFSLESFEELANEYVGLYRIASRCCNLQKGTEQALQTIKASGISQSILSASEQAYLEEAINYYRINDYFDRLVGLDNHYAVSKIDNGKKLLKELSLSPSETLFIGDTVHDYEVAKAIGCDCVLLACGHQRLEKLKTCPVPIIHSLEELLS